MRIEVTQCSMCKHYSEEQYCEIWQQYITNDAFYCACGVKADRKTENCSEKPNNSTRSKMEQVDKDINVRSKDEPKTSCKTCRYGEVDEGYVRCAYYSKATDKDEPQADCNGCKFVGTYDTEFPCANCSRKTKDYYAKTEPQTERSSE